MKHTFYAHLTATLTFTDEEFNLIWLAAERHYSSDCKSMVQPGGILYGEKNRRKFSSEDPESNTSTIGMECTLRQLGLLLKSVENHYAEVYQNINAVLQSISRQLQSKQEKANSFLDLLK